MQMAKRPRGNYGPSQIGWGDDNNDELDVYNN